jgi:TAT-translocated FGD2 family F420-dependent dehydrogenase
MIGFVLSHEQFPAPELIALGLAAEQAGFDAVSTSDHFHPWQDNEGHAGHAWISLAALGQRTERLTMGTAVTCPTYRYRPAVVAQAFASLGLLYPGRMFLGMGAGEALNEIPAGGWGHYRERAARLVEAVAVIRKLWSGEWIDYRGQYYQVQHARLYDVPPRPVPIYLVASGPKSMRLAGQHGDGLITDGQRALAPDLRTAFEEGARAAGKDPRTLPIVAEHFVVVGDEAEAQRWAPLWRFLPISWERYVTDPVSIQHRAEADVPLEQVYAHWPVSRDPEVHARAIQQLIDGGVGLVLVHSPQQDQRGVIQFYGREVLPRVRSGRSPTPAAAGAR